MAASKSVNGNMFSYLLSRRKLLALLARTACRRPTTTKMLRNVMANMSICGSGGSFVFTKGGNRAT
jgi:hypothetical protein